MSVVFQVADDIAAGEEIEFEKVTASVDGGDAEFTSPIVTVVFSLHTLP